MQNGQACSKLVCEAAIVLKVNNALLLLVRVATSEGCTDALLDVDGGKRQSGIEQRASHMVLLCIPTRVENDFKAVNSELGPILYNGLVAERVRTAGEDP